MSEVVIRSTENGPNLLMVEGKVVQAWCRCGGSTLRLGVANYAVPKARAEITQNAPIQRPWTDTLSGGLWARFNNFEKNSSILDSAQAQAILGSIAPRGPTSQLPTSLFTNNFRVT